MSSLVLEQQQIERFLKIHFECAYYSFFLIHLELKRQINAFMHSHTWFNSSLYPLSDQNGAKTIPLGSDTYLYGLYKGVPLGV